MSLPTTRTMVGSGRPSGTARAAKVRKTDGVSASHVVSEEMASAQILLEEVGRDVKPGELTMFRAALPHALYLEESGPAQEEVVKVFQGLCLGAKSAREAWTAGLKEEMRQLEEDKYVGDAELEQATGCAKLAKDTMEKDSLAESEAKTREEEAEAYLATGKEAAESLVAEQEVLEASRALAERVATELLQPLKDGSWGNWRQRNKLLEKLTEHLGAVPDFSPPLLATLQVVLKLKPGDRGPFAVTALQFFDEQEKGRAEALLFEIGRFDEKRAECARLVESSAAALESRKIEHAQATEAALVSRAASREAVASMRAVKKLQDNLAPRQKKLDNQIQAGEKALAIVTRLIEEFEGALARRAGKLADVQPVAEVSGAGISEVEIHAETC